MIGKRGDLFFLSTLPPTTSIVMPEEYFSDSDVQPVKAPSRKRKTAASEASTTKTKKAKVASDTSNSGILDKAISELASSVANYGIEFFTDSEDEPEPIRVAIRLAEYIAKLEAALAQAKSSSRGAPATKQKTRAELEANAEKIRRAAVSGITKQMTVRVSSSMPN